LAGIAEPLELDADEFLNLIFATIVDDVNGMVDKHKVRSEIRKTIREESEKMDPEKWGESEEAQAEMLTAMKLASQAHR
jgi:hypothetical protein